MPAAFVQRPIDGKRGVAAVLGDAPQRAGQRLPFQPAPLGDGARHAAPTTKNQKQGHEGAIDEHILRQDMLYERARRVGLCGPLGERRPDAWEGQLLPDGRGQGAPLVDALRASAQRRLVRSFDVGRLSTAISWFEDFVRDTSRVPFVALHDRQDIAAGIYNAETLELMGEYMRLRGSRKTSAKGAPITADHIQACVGMIRTLRSSEAHYGIILPEADVNLTRLLKDMRKEQGPRGERRDSRGFRAQHFQELISRGMRLLFTDGEWTLGLTAHNLCLRGGEIGRTDSRALDPSRDFTITDVDEETPCAESRFRPWCTAWITSIKDVSARHRPVPLQICARGDPQDPLCTHTHLMAHVARRKAQVAQCAGVCAWCKRAPGAPRPNGTPPASCKRANAPMFVTDTGSAYCTEDVRALGRRFAEAAGIPPDLVGGKLWRIGGATDYLEVLGENGARVLKARGRWGTDVAFIYARANARSMLDASAAVGEADARAIEEMTAGWVQPATFR